MAGILPNLRSPQSMSPAHRLNVASSEKDVCCSAFVEVALQSEDTEGALRLSYVLMSEK